MESLFMHQNSLTIFCDVHGVLVQSSKMLQNYEITLVEMFSKYGISKTEATKFHYAGLRLYSKLLNEMKEQKLTGTPFLQAMDAADKQWDTLLQDFVPDKQTPELESRNVEFLAGQSSNTFYDDGKRFIQSLENLKNEDANFDFFIVSNSHTKHIEGLLQGAGITTFDTKKILGWDKTQSLKNLESYYKKLLQYSANDLNIIIGNSEDEMVFGKKAGFKTIFIEREVKEPITFEKAIDVKLPNLQNLPNLIKEHKF